MLIKEDCFYAFEAKIWDLQHLLECFIVLRFYCLRKVASLNWSSLMYHFHSLQSTAYVQILHLQQIKNDLYQASDRLLQAMICY